MNPINPYRRLMMGYCFNPSSELGRPDAHHQKLISNYTPIAPSTADRWFGPRPTWASNSIDPLDQPMVLDPWNKIR